MNPPEIDGFLQSESTQTIASTFVSNPMVMLSGETTIYGNYNKGEYGVDEVTLGQIEASVCFVFFTVLIAYYFKKHIDKRYRRDFILEYEKGEQLFESCLRGEEY